jgi:nitronate monooxygenase
MLDALRLPIVQAPMAGGPSTPALAAAVSNAGGLGFVAAGYRTADAFADDLAAARRQTDGPIGANLFVAGGAPGDPAEVARYAERVAGEAARAGVAVGQARFDDDGWAEKLAIVREAAPDVVSFTFGCPDPAVVAELQEAGSAVWLTVTGVEEAREAVAAGASALVVQGVEAGGHRGTFADGGGGDHGLLALIALVRAAVGVPLVATGGIADGRGVAAVLAAGAAAAQLGTAFLRCPEAGTSAVHREAVARPGATGLTRAFSGRLARGIVNRFMEEHSAAAPRAYPEVVHLTAPLRAHGSAVGDADVVNLWAGQAHELARAVPAAELVAALAAEARTALAEAAQRL